MVAGQPQLQARHRNGDGDEGPMSGSGVSGVDEVVRLVQAGKPVADAKRDEVAVANLFDTFFHELVGKGQ